MDKTYTAELTITQAVADRSHGGVIYYFCHIHSKMSGKIQIMSPDGTPYTNAKAEKSLYSPVVRGSIDVACGTTGVANYHDEGGMACAERFVPGAIDTPFDHCLQACRPIGSPVLCGAYWGGQLSCSEALSSCFVVHARLQPVQCVCLL